MHGLCLLLPLLALFFMPLQADAFKVPEKLQYDLTWTGLKAGEATLEVSENGTGIAITSRAVSAPWVSLFYTVEDVVVSSLRKGQLTINGVSFGAVPASYRIKIREGRHRRDKESVFDLASRKVTYTNYLDKETASFDISGTTLDPLSSFYFVRHVPLEVGRSVHVEVFDSKKFYQVEVKVLKKETIKTDLGTFNTIVIRPLLKSEGIFNRKGDVTIWLTDDERRLPVMLKTKIVVGSVKATLVRAL